MARKRARSEWQKPGMLSYQKCNGMAESYTRARVGVMHRHEVSFGDPRLYQWVMGYKPFLLWGKPTKFDVSNSMCSFRGSRGLV